MSDYIEITNLSRHAFRRAGRSFPAGADNAVIIKADTLTKVQKSAIENESRLSVNPCPPPQGAPKAAPKSPPKSASKSPPKTAAKDAPKSPPKAAAKDTHEGASEAAPEDAPEAAPKTDLEDVPKSGDAANETKPSKADKKRDA